MFRGVFPDGRQVRGAIRTTVLIATLVETLCRFMPLYLASGGRVSMAQRITWLHTSFNRLARRLSLELTFPPAADDITGLTVSNHLSYLDIMVYSAARPYRFVAKSEIRGWPLLGILARLGGTIFVERGRSLQVAKATRQIEESLRQGIPVLLFPEGTSSDGSSVLPFLPSLFEPAIRAGASVRAAAIRYRADDGAEAAISYWGSNAFFPHLFQTLCLRGLAAEIDWNPPGTFPERKTAARLTWGQVRTLREQGMPQQQSVALLECSR